MMSAEKENPRLSGKSYRSVSDLISKQQLGGKVQQAVSEMNSASFIARRLSVMRVKAGFTQQEFANKAGVRQSTVSKWENAVDDEIPLGVLYKYAAITNSTVELICGKRLTHVQHFHRYARLMKGHLDKLADIASNHDELRPAISAFFSEAFFRLSPLLETCQREMPEDGAVEFDLNLLSDSPPHTDPIPLPEPS